MKHESYDSASLKIVSYNILGTNKDATAEKVKTVLREMPADVWILAEIFEETQLPEGYKLFWHGDAGIKGLGVIVRDGLDCHRLEMTGLTKYCVPVFVDNRLIVGMWPTQFLETKNVPYPQLLDLNLRALEPYLKNQPTAIAGDMNCYVGQSGERKSYNIKTIFDWLQERGFKSAYHEITSESLGEELQKTLNFRNSGKHFFHIDYAFANVPIKSFEMANWDGLQWQNAPIESDHAWLTIEI